MKPAKVHRVNMPSGAPFSPHKAVAVFVHDEMLSAAHPLLRKPMAKIFVFDEYLHAKWPIKRLQFVADCLSELQDVEIWLGDTRSNFKRAWRRANHYAKHAEPSIKSTARTFSTDMAARDAIYRYRN